MADGQVIIQIKGDSTDYDKAIKGLGQQTQSSLGNAIKGSFIGNLFANAFSAAAGTISNAMDGAISRVDTLNRFPKMMEQIGFSADDAKSAIDRMSSHIQGLPTTLDSIVSSTQRIVQKVGDVDKATDIVLAFNDALVAGGQSSQVQSAALEQYIQGISKGKFELEEWRSITTAMPGQIEQVAKSLLGASGDANALYEALKDGTISIDDFTNAFVNLDKQGLDGMGSFAEQAKTGANGIQTSMDNAAYAVVINVGKIIDAVNANGEIEGAFNAAKGIINDWGGKAVEAVKWVKDNFGTIAPAVGGVVGAMAAFKAAMGISAAVSAVTGAIEAWKLANDGLRISQILLNAALDANPVMLVVTILGALVGALIAAYNTNEDFRNAVNSAWQAITEIVGGAIESVVQFFTDFAENAQMGAQAFYDNVIQPISQIPEQIMNFLTQIVDNVVNFFTTIGEYALMGAQMYYDNVILPISQLPGQILAFLTQIISDIANWVAQMVQGAIDAGSQFLNNIITFYSQLPGNIWNFLSNAISMIAQFVSRVPQQALQAAQGFFRNIQGGFNSAVSFVSGIPSQIIGIFSGAAGWLVDSGASLLNGFIQGIKDGFSNAISAVQNGLTEIRQFFPFSPAKRGPFSGHGYTTYSGKALMRDFAASIDNNAKGAVKAARTALTAVQSEFDGNSAFAVPLNASATLSGVSTVDILGNSFIANLDAITSRLDAINSRLESIEEKLDKDTVIKLNGREFGRFAREYM